MKRIILIQHIQGLAIRNYFILSFYFMNLTGKNDENSSYHNAQVKSDSDWQSESD